jgi:hypothetical protein
MRDTIDMAREAGMVYREFEDEFANANTDGVDLKTLKAFEALARADEREVVEDLLQEYDMVNSAFARDFRARSCPPCNEDCDQGRNCPARKDK